MLILMLELVLAFNMELGDEDKEEEKEEDKKAKDEGGSPPFGRLDCLSLLINKPDRPVKIKFTKQA